MRWVLALMAQHPAWHLPLGYKDGEYGAEQLPSGAYLGDSRALFGELPAALDANEREFLRTLVGARPDWSLLDIPHLAELPAIRWRLQNLEQLSRRQPSDFVHSPSRWMTVLLDDTLDRYDANFT